MRFHPVGLTLLLAATTWAYPTAATEVGDTPEAWSTLLDIEIVGTILKQAEDRGFPDGCPEGVWKPLDECVQNLPDSYTRRLPRRDGWGRKFLVATFDGATMVVSNGEDGVSNTIDMIKEYAESDGAAPDASLGGFGDDVVLAVGQGVLNGPATLGARQRKTMADLRSIGTAVESFAFDNDAYPLQVVGLQEVAAVRVKLEPLYIRRLSLVDGWGKPYYYWSDGKGYLIASAGSDGVLEALYEVLPPDPSAWGGKTGNPETDIVFADGRFVQWVEGDR